MLRHEAGFSVALADEKVRSLPKTTDGKREKVKSVDIQKIIQDANAPSPVLKIGGKIRPFRKEILEQIRANAAANKN